MIKLKFRSPIYLDKGPKVNKLCYTCGNQYESTFKQIEKRQNQCPVCLYNES